MAVLDSPSLTVLVVFVDISHVHLERDGVRAQELCESRGGRPGLLTLMVLMVSMDIKQR